MINYEKSPKKIQAEAINFVKENASLTHLSILEKKIARQLAICSGDLSILDDIRFSKGAINAALEAFDEESELLCDTPAVISGLKQKYLKNEPICLIDKANVISQAKASKHTRSMVAVDLWKPYLQNSIILIGTETTALSRLLELLEKVGDDNKKPALIIATPVGFGDTEKSKQYLWDNSEALSIPCITLLGTRGGNDIASTIMNKLLQIHHKHEDT